MNIKYLEKYKTGTKVRHWHKIIGTNKEIELEGDEYKIQISELILLIIELERKKRFYNSIIGKLFFNGFSHIIDINYVLNKLKNIPVIATFV